MNGSGHTGSNEYLSGMLSGRFYYIRNSCIMKKTKKKLKILMIILSVLFAVGFAYPALVVMLMPSRTVAFGTILAYTVMQCLYTGFLKRLPYVDVMTLAAGFVLRAVAGAAIIKAYISPWLLVCTFTLSMFLAFCKRRHEREFAPSPGKISLFIPSGLLPHYGLLSGNTWYGLSRQGGSWIYCSAGLGAWDALYPPFFRRFANPPQASLLTLIPSTL